MMSELRESAEFLLAVVGMVSAVVLLGMVAQ